MRRAFATIGIRYTSHWPTGMVTSRQECESWAEESNPLCG
jgi:hypothetical protein